MSIEFGTPKAKHLFLLRKVLTDLDYIGRETELSETENELRMLAIEDINEVIEFIDQYTETYIEKKLKEKTKQGEDITRWFETEYGGWSEPDEVEEKMNEATRIGAQVTLLNELIEELNA